MSRCEIRSTVKVSKRESKSENSNKEMNKCWGEKGGKDNIGLQIPGSKSWTHKCKGQWRKNYWVLQMSILPGYLGCNFQYTPALEKNANTLPRVRMSWKICLQFSPLGPRDCPRVLPAGNLLGLGVQIASGGVFSNTSLLSAVCTVLYCTIIISQKLRWKEVLVGFSVS